MFKSILMSHYFIVFVVCLKQSTTIKKFPYLVSIRRNFLEIENFTSIHICAGIIITEIEVLTTASCLHDVSGNYLNKPFSFTIVAGVTNLKDPPNVERYSIATTIHKDFSIHTMKNDIGIIRVNKMLPIDNVKVALARLYGNEVTNAKKCRVVGWGATAMKPFANLSGILYTTDVKTDTDCLSTLFYEYNFKSDGNQLCASPQNINDSLCFQDTGSPLVCNNLVVGLAIVYNDCRGVWRRGTAYTRISKYLAFINKLRGSCAKNVVGTIWIYILLKFNI